MNQEKISANWLSTSKEDISTDASVQERPSSSLSHKNLSNINWSLKILTALDLSSIDFSKASLKKSLFTYCDFSSSLLIDVDISEAKFCHCDFRDAKLRTQYFSNVIFENCLFNSNTELPFRKDEAIKKGFIFRV